MPRVGFEPTIPAFERAKTVHALDRATTVIGLPSVYVITKTEKSGQGQSRGCRATDKRMNE
jgi:hypothetical protein